MIFAFHCQLNDWSPMLLIYMKKIQHPIQSIPRVFSRVQNNNPIWSLWSIRSRFISILYSIMLIWPVNCHGVINLNKRAYNVAQSFLNLIEPDNRPLTHVLLRTFEDLDRLYHSTKQIKSLPHFYRHYLRTITILLFRLPIFNSFIRVPAQYWEQNHHDIKKLQFASQDFCLSAFPVDLEHNFQRFGSLFLRLSIHPVQQIIMTVMNNWQLVWVKKKYSKPMPHNGKKLRVQCHRIQMIQVFLIELQSSNSRRSLKAMLHNLFCSSVWIRGVTTFLLNALRLNCTGNPADPNLEHRCWNKSIPFLSTDIGGQYIHQYRTVRHAWSALVWATVIRYDSCIYSKQ